MVQLAFLAILPLVLPALGANIQARENWGSTKPAPIISTIYASSSYANGGPGTASSYPLTTSIATAITPRPTYFDCGGSNFTLTSSIGGAVPTGVTTVIIPGGTSSAIVTVPGGTSSTIVTVPQVTISSRAPGGTVTVTEPQGTLSIVTIPGGTISTSPADGTGVVRRENYGTTTPAVAPVTTSSSFGAPIFASSIAFECPYPTSTAYADGTVSSRAGVSSTSSISSPGSTQLSAQGADETGAAVGMTVGVGSVVLGAVAVLTNLF